MLLTECTIYFIRQRIKNDSIALSDVEGMFTVEEKDYKMLYHYFDDNSNNMICFGNTCPVIKKEDININDFTYLPADSRGEMVMVSKVPLTEKEYILNLVFWDYKKNCINLTSKLDRLLDFHISNIKGSLYAGMTVNELINTNN